MAIIKPIVDIVGAGTDGSTSLTPNVGIGTSTPGAALDVRGEYTQRPLTDATGVWQLLNSAGANRVKIDLDSGDTTLSLRNNAGTYSIILDSNGGSQIDGGGLGIGTVPFVNTTRQSSPGLSIESENPGITFTDEGAVDSGWSMAILNGNLYISSMDDDGTNVADVIYASRSNSRVGINNTSPDGVLDCTPDTITTDSYAYPFPRVTTTQKNALTGMTVGAHIVDITLNEVWWYNGASWVKAY